jgi:hypothetical protein
MFLAGRSEPGMLRRQSDSVAETVSSDASVAEEPLIVAEEPLIGLVSLMAHDDDRLIKRSDERLRWASAVTIEIWLLLSGAVMAYAPKDSFQYLEGTEKFVAVLAFTVMLLANLSRMVPLLYRDHVVLKQRHSFWKNGVFIGAFTSQFISMSTHAYMAFYKVPVVYDPVTGARVHLIRWAEWVSFRSSAVCLVLTEANNALSRFEQAPLAGLLTFLAEEIDCPSPDQYRMTRYHAIAMVCSVLCGLVFPFCPNLQTWLAILAVACILFSSIFVRVFQKRRALAQRVKGVSLQSVGDYNRARLSLRAMDECAAVWTIMVILHFFAVLAPRYVSSDSIFNTPALCLIAETFCEVMSKYLHIFVVEDCYKTLFDDRAINSRKLEKLRQILTVVWERSPDSMAISMKLAGGKSVCLLSPTFFALVNGKDMEHPNQLGDRALVMEFSGHKSDSPSEVFSIGLNEPRDQEDTSFAKGMLSEATMEELQPTIASVSELIRKAWKRPEDKAVLTHDIVICTGSKTETDTTESFDDSTEAANEALSVANCEATISKLDDHTAILIIIRDVSERVKLFEAEKMLAIETTAREKDSETNRFTRHEVKNGLLAALHLCESLQESLHRAEGRDGASDAKLQNCVTDLDWTIQEIFDTVMSEAMVRDVIHEVYEPKLERVDVETVLRAAGGVPKHERFPITTSSTLPLFRLDPQLLRYIHRNAITNACKYGEKGGLVQTQVHYAEARAQLRVDVINLPGFYHQKLREMGSKAGHAVFVAGRRLHTDFGDTATSAGPEESHSSGDGAWIMRQCARALGGDCSIRFEKERTVFSMQCPVHLYKAPKALSKKYRQRELPSSVWAIAIDDSQVQRKLLNKYLSHLGIRKSRRVILGASDEECSTFVDVARRSIQENPLDRFLIIADENLEIVEDHSVSQGTVSGSLAVQELLGSLNPQDEKRVLALIRSANDSKDDVALYNSRSHGFIPKGPVRKDDVLVATLPFWFERFKDESESEESDESDENEDDGFTTGADLVEMMEKVDSYLEMNDFRTSWTYVWERLLILKGDLMTVGNPNSSRVVAIVDAIESLRGPDPPEDFPGKWTLIRALIISLA